jgi:hypothetical protein
VDPTILIMLKHSDLLKTTIALALVSLCSWGCNGSVNSNHNQLALNVSGSKIVKSTPVLRLPFDRVFLADIAETGDHIAVTTDSKVVALLTQSSGKWNVDGRLKHDSNVSRAVFLNGGSSLVTHDYEHLYVWSPSTKKLITRLSISAITGISCGQIDELTSGPDAGQLTIFSEFAKKCFVVEFRNGSLSVKRQAPWPAIVGGSTVSLKSAGPTLTLAFHLGSEIIEAYDWNVSSIVSLPSMVEPVVAGEFASGKAFCLTTSGAIYALELSTPGARWAQFAKGCAPSTAWLAGLRSDRSTGHLSVRAGSEAYLFDISTARILLKTAIPQTGMSLLPLPNGAGLALIPHASNELMLSYSP